MTENIYTVCAITEKLRKSLTSLFPFVWVKGEVTNCSRAGSGHIYFTLKDERAQLNCVWFASKQKPGGQNFDPLTGEVFAEPQPAPSELARNGAQLLCAGALDVYGARGQYQLIVELAQAEGAGRLAREFELRKRQLAELGYFNQERKRPLPVLPLKIALLTSPHGAAVHDFLELAEKRGLGSTIRLFPVPVQGQGAAEKIAAALALANEQGWAQVIVLIRGGGSLEDLWAFNEEIVARAVYESKLPVLAGIGHEIDFSLADLTADARAATPSHAAQMLWPLRSELWQRLDSLQLGLWREISLHWEGAERMLAHAAERLNWSSPLQMIQRLDMRLQNLERNLHREMAVAYSSRQEKCAILAIALEKAGAFQKRQEMARSNLERLAEKLRDSLWRKLESEWARLRVLSASLEAASPDKPLQRGYALLAANGRLISSIEDVQPGEMLEATLRDGSLVLEARGKKARQAD